jgi:hypothetical protein
MQQSSTPASGWNGAQPEPLSADSKWPRARGRVTLHAAALTAKVGLSHILLGCSVMPPTYPVHDVPNSHGCRLPVAQPSRCS